MTTIGRWALMAFGLMLMTAACGSGDNLGTGEQATAIKRTPTPDNEFTPAELEATVDNLVDEMNKHAIKPMQMAVLLKDLTNFWATVATASNRAMGELGVTGNVLGPVDPNADLAKTVQLQNQQINESVADGTEGLGVAPFDISNQAAIDEAIAKGVHVVTLDTDLVNSKRAIYVGTLNKAAGATGGNTLLAMLPPAPGTVIIHGTNAQSWLDGFDRTVGAKDALEAAGYTVQVRESTYTTTGEVEDVDAMKTQIETAVPPVVGMIGLFNVSYRCAMAAEAAKKTDLPIVAFDFDPVTVDYMRKGLIKATHAQRQYYQGYLVPYILYGIKTIGLDETKKILAPQMVDDSRFDTGIDVVPADKIDAYNDFLASIGATQ